MAKKEKEIKPSDILYVKNSVQIIPVMHLGKHIELCARNAYKSEDKVTETSWVGMVKGLAKRGHNSCFEHAPIYLEVDPKQTDNSTEMLLKLIKASKYVKIKTALNKYRIYTNGRVILETIPEWLNPLLTGDFNIPGVEIFTPNKNDMLRRVSVRIISPRAIMDEILRHRVFSPTAESTRYVDYLGKFSVSSWGSHETTKEQDDALKAAFEDCRKHYDNLKALGAHKDVCRLVLSLGIKSDLIFTGHVCDFLGNFMELRTASTADKTVQAIAKDIEKLLK